MNIIIDEFTNHFLPMMADFMFSYRGAFHFVVLIGTLLVISRIKREFSK